MVLGVVLGLLLSLTSGYLIAQTSCCGGPAPDHSGLPGSYGVNGSYNPLFPRSSALTTAYNGGFRWVRIYIPWGDVQTTSSPDPANWNWGAVDAAINRAYQAGFSILVSFRNVPDWANNGVTPRDNACNGNNDNLDEDIPPASETYFKTFVRETVRRYTAAVRAWELWNEPDLCNFWRGSPDDWRRLILVPGYQGIVESGCVATIVAPGISGVGGGVVSKLDDFLTHTENGQKVLDVPIDVYSFHRYGSVATVKNMLDNADPYFRCTADGTKCTSQYWLTEFGYDDSNSELCHVCSWGHLSGQGPGDAAIDIYRHCWDNTNWCFKAFYWDLINENAPPVQGCNCDTALLNPDGTARTRFNTLSNWILGP
jgi:hypothetical protein